MSDQVIISAIIGASATLISVIIKLIPSKNGDSETMKRLSVTISAAEEHYRLMRGVAERSNEIYKYQIGAFNSKLEEIKRILLEREIR